MDRNVYLSILIALFKKCQLDLDKIRTEGQKRQRWSCNALSPLIKFLQAGTYYRCARPAYLASPPAPPPPPAAAAFAASLVPVNAIEAIQCDLRSVFHNHHKSSCHVSL